MKEHTGKPPIDDLFARKLGDMSLSPRADGFERLKARMEQQKPETRIVFWRNPIVQRSMAAAACLAVVSLLGLLYWPSPAQESAEVAIANQQSIKSNPSIGNQEESRQDKAIASTPFTSTNPKRTTEEVAGLTRKLEVKPKNNLDSRSFKSNKDRLPVLPVGNNEPMLAQTKPAEEKASVGRVSPDKLPTVTSTTADQIAEVRTPAKATVQTERVLEVTIAEPASLVAARQVVETAIEEKSIIAATDKSEKEPKAGGLWQQVKRIKQGEVFARRDNPGDDDRGLLGRAYNGLKHNLEKDKPAKQ